MLVQLRSGCIMGGWFSIHHTCLSFLSSHCSCPKKGACLESDLRQVFAMFVMFTPPTNPLQQLPPALKTDMIMRACSGKVSRRNKSWLSPTMLIGPKGLAGESERAPIWTQKFQPI